MICKKRIFAGALAAAMSLAVLTGCQSGDGSISDPSAFLPSTTSEDSSAEASSTEASSSEALTQGTDDTEIYNAYIDVYNYIVDDVNEAVIDYFDSVNYEEAFSLYDQDYYDCYTVSSSVLDCVENAYTLASGLTTKGAADEAMIALYQPMMTLCETINQVAAYTDTKSYYDDDYAKAKELHATLWTTLQEYDARSATFMEQIDVIAEEHQAKALQNFKDEGMVTMYAITVAVDNAQAVQDAIYEQDVSDENLLDLDLTAIQPLYDTFAASVEECATALADEDQLAAEGLSGGAYTEMFQDSLVDTKVALTDMIQRVKNQEAFSEFDLTSAFAPDGSIQNFYEKVSDLIDQYNYVVTN